MSAAAVPCSCWALMRDGSLGKAWDLKAGRCEVHLRLGTGMIELLIGVCK